MSNWAEYVRKFYTLSSEEQRTEWAKLTPDQKEHFEAARAAAEQPAPELPQPIASKPSRSGIGARSCLIVLAVGVLAIAGLAFLGNIEKRRAEAEAQEEARRKAEEVAKEREQTIQYFHDNKAAILAEVKDLLAGGELEEAVSLAAKYLPSEDTELVGLHEKAKSEVKTADRLRQIEHILAEVKQVPAANVVKNRDLYLKLTQLDPDEPLYAEKLQFYSLKVDQLVEEARRERERDQKRRAQEQREVEARIARFGEAPVQSSWDGSYPAVKRYLKRIANDPDSIKIAACTKVYHTKKGWLVGCDYRGRNAFGGMVKQSNWFTIVHGNVVEMHDAAAYKP